MSNYTREYTFIIPPSTFSGNHYYTSARAAAQGLMKGILAVESKLVQQGKISPADLALEWYEISLEVGRPEYRVAIFSTARAVTPEIVKTIHDLATNSGFTTLIRTADMQDLFCSGKPEFAAYFMNTYMFDGINTTSADVGAKDAYDKQNCKPLVTNAVVDQEVDLSLPETKTTVLRDLGIRNKLYQLKSVTISGDTVVCKLSGPQGEITHTVPVKRDVWSKWPIAIKEAIDEETV